MEFPTLINWTSPFLFKVCWVVFFTQILIERSVANSGESDQTPCVATDLVLHCLPMPHKKALGL